MICGCSYFLVFNTVLHSVWNIYCWVEGRILFMVSCEGKHKVLLILKRGSGIFHKSFSPFHHHPPEIKNDNSLILFRITFWYLSYYILVLLGSHFSTFWMRIANSWDRNVWNGGSDFTTTQCQAQRIQIC